MDMVPVMHHNLSTYSDSQTRFMPRRANNANPGIQRRKPLQRRARLTVDSIFEATAQLLTEVGYAHASTNRIAARAGVSVGTLYQYFQDKESIVRGLCELHVATVRDSVAAQIARVDETTLEAGTRAIIEALLRAQSEHRAVNRLLQEQIPVLIGFEHIEQIHEMISALVREGLRRRAEEIRSVDLELATFTIVHAVFGVSAAALRRTKPPLDDAALCNELTLMVVRYLAPHH